MPVEEAPKRLLVVHIVIGKVKKFMNGTFHDVSLNVILTFALPCMATLNHLSLRDAPRSILRKLGSI